MVKRVIKLESLATAVLSLYFYQQVNGNWILFILLLFIPDISMIGYFKDEKLGASVYNLVHNYILVAGLILIGVFANNNLYLSWGLILSFHVSMDRVMGFGLKYPDSFKSTHLQKLIFLVTLFILLWVVTPYTKAANSVPILLYHYIAYNPNPKDVARYTLSVPPDKFEAQMEYLSKNGYTPITLNTLYGIFSKQTTPPAKPVVLTFDDGYIDFYTIAFPILRKYNFSAVSFISTGLIGGSYYMNWDQIKELQRSGLVSFEGHTISHPHLTSLSATELSRQLNESKKVIESQTGHHVNFIAYPYGASNELVRNAAFKGGYVGGVGTWFGKATGPSINLPRIRITGQMSLKDFAAKL